MPFVYNANDPVSARNERARQECVRIGRELDDSATMKLRIYLFSDSAIVRKMAASAMKKFIAHSPARYAQSFAFYLTYSLSREDAPQVLQYKIRALGACGRYANVQVLDELKALFQNERLPEYVRVDANQAMSAIEADMKREEMNHLAFCSACHAFIADESQRERSVKAYQKPYCRKCQDERDFAALEFERSVDEAKLRQALNGVWVQSEGEVRIANYLVERRIAFDYDKRFRLAGGKLLRPDFYLPEFDVYIEYWGMDTREYLANKAEKGLLYKRARKRLVSLDYNELDEIEKVLEQKLSRYVGNLDRDQGEGLPIWLGRD